MAEPNPSKGGKAPKGAGKSSFDLINTDILKQMLPVKPGSVILDLACGKGHYALFLAPLAGEKGLIYAADLWEQGLEMLEQAAKEKNITTILPMKADATQGLDIDDHSIDLVLMATVLHDFNEMDAAATVLKQVHNLLRPGGCLAVIEFKKMDGPPGPPIHIRLAPGDTEQLVTQSGFTKQDYSEIGDYNYLMTFNA